MIETIARKEFKGETLFQNQQSRDVLKVVTQEILVDSQENMRDGLHF